MNTEQHTAEQKRRRDIYMFDGGEGRQYIGQTVDLEKRQRHHQHLCSSGSHVDLYNAVRDDLCGWDAFPLHVIATGWWTDEQTNDAEIGYIAYYNTYYNGLNMTKGGEATTGWVPKQETRDRISASNSGRKMPPRSPEYRANMSAIQLGKKRSPETCAKISAAKLGVKQTQESNAKRSATMEGKAKHPEHGARVSATLRARGISFTKDAQAKARLINTGRKVPTKDRYRMGGVAGAKFRAENIDHAMSMLAEGKSQRVVAEAIGVAECTIPRWIKWYNGRDNSDVILA